MRTEHRRPTDTNTKVVETMTDNRTRAAQLNERLTEIRSEQRQLLDNLGVNPISQVIEIGSLEFEAKTIEAQLKTLEQS